MSSLPFIVLDRSTKRVLHQARTLGEARGFSEASSQPTAIGIIPELHVCTEWQYVLQAINVDTGEILAESSAMEFSEACEVLCSVKVMLVPECAAGKAVQR